MASASRLAAQRLERAQLRADAAGARKTPSTTSQSSYGSFWGGSDENGNPIAGSPAPAGATTPGGMGMLQRSKTLDTSAMAAAMGAAGGSSRQPYAPADGPRAEIDEPCVPLTMSDAFAVATQEGALHENHDRGATVILPDGTCLFTCLDGHGAEGASVSGYSTRNLLAGCAAALQEGQSPSDAVTSAFARTAATMPHNVSDCRFSGSTAILMVMSHGEGGARTLTTGWVGDSRAVVSRTRVQPGPARTAPKLEAVPLTKDHKPTDPKERQRLLEARAIVRPSRVINPHTGAWIEVGAVRVWDASQIYGVAMSRSLGDMQVHPYLIPVPDISTRQLDANDRIVVLATDGVWDVMENEEAGQLSMQGTPAESCQEIVSVCARRWDTQMPGRRDDITTVVVDLLHPDLTKES